MAKKEKPKREEKKAKRTVEKKSDAARGPFETRMGQTGANR